MIKVVQKGTPFFFSPALLRIYYGTTDNLVYYSEASVANAGKAAKPDDITIIWESNEVAIITLTGEEEKPKIIKIDVSS